MQDQALFTFEHQVVELFEGELKVGVVALVAQGVHRHDGVHHRRVDGAESLGVLEAIEHPMLGVADGASADLLDALALPALEELVGGHEEVGNPVLAP